MVTYAGSVVNFGTENGATVKEENDVNENGGRQKRSQVHIINTLFKKRISKVYTKDFLLNTFKSITFLRRHKKGKEILKLQKHLPKRTFCRND
jgi:predicted nucleotidyltransferase